MATPRQGLVVLREAARDGRLDRLCDAFALELVSVFGSAPDPSVAEPADIDIAVRFADAGPGDLIGVTTAFIELLGVTEVDVLDLGPAGVVARSRALGPGAEPLYERESGMYALAQMAAIAYEMETAPMRRLDLELLAKR